MSVYPPAIDARFCSLANAGRARGANGVGTAASFVCGCFTRISLAVVNETRSIAEARFQTNGCGYMTAAADLVTADITGRRLTELHSADANEMGDRICVRLGELPESRPQCISVVVDAMRAALADYRTFAIEEFRGEKALICTCFGVSEETIQAFVTANHPVSVDEVRAACRAGSGCGSCRMAIQEMIDDQAFGQ